jgi:hypothetical protein
VYTISKPLTLKLVMQSHDSKRRFQGESFSSVCRNFGFLFIFSYLEQRAKG